MRIMINHLLIVSIGLLGLGLFFFSFIVASIDKRIETRTIVPIINQIINIAKYKELII